MRKLFFGRTTEKEIVGVEREKERCKK